MRQAVYYRVHAWRQLLARSCYGVSVGGVLRVLGWLLLAAWLAENGREAECAQLLAWHLLPWSTRFLSVFVDNAGHPFYTALGKLAQLTLADWQSRLIIPVAEKTLYR